MKNNSYAGNKLYSGISALVCRGSVPHGILIECENEDEGYEFARFIAGCLLCTGSDKPCGECPACRKFYKNGHPDVIVTDGIRGKSSSFTVDAVREIRSSAFVVPNESDKKIYILKNGGNMNEQAQNAILKILEEPPEYVYFIIITPSKSTVLETVLSRVCVYSLNTESAGVSEKEKEAVKALVMAILSVSELKLLEETAAYQKNSQFAETVLELLSEIFRDALVKKSGYNGNFRFEDEVNAVCSALTSKSIMNCAEVCGELIASIQRKCNNNLLITRMCYEFKRAIGR